MNTFRALKHMLLLAVVLCSLSAVAQSKYDRWGGVYYAYHAPEDAKLTPAPEGFRPFYISHYGRHGSRYISNRSGFDTPYFMMLHADSLDELTPTGRKVLREMNSIMHDTEGRWGELTGFGKRQLEDIGQRMVRNFPEVLSPGANVKCLSTIVPRCIESMGSTALKMLQECPTLHVTMEASKRNQWFMNHQDINMISVQIFKTHFN